MVAVSEVGRFYQRQARKGRKEQPQPNGNLGSGKWSADAEMQPAAETAMRWPHPAEIETVRVRKHRRIAIGRAKNEGNLIAPCKVNSAG